MFTNIYYDEMANVSICGELEMCWEGADSAGGYMFDGWKAIHRAY